MKAKAIGNKGRVELGEYIVAEPEICHRKPTFKGTRIMVFQALERVVFSKEPFYFVVISMAQFGANRRVLAHGFLCRDSMVSSE